MTSTNVHVGGIHKEVDYQKLGPALLIASGLVLAIRTAKSEPKFCKQFESTVGILSLSPAWKCKLQILHG